MGPHEMEDDAQRRSHRQGPLSLFGIMPRQEDQADEEDGRGDDDPPRDRRRDLDGRRDDERPVPREARAEDHHPGLAPDSAGCPEVATTAREGDQGQAPRDRRHPERLEDGQTKVPDPFDPNSRDSQPAQQDAARGSRTGLEMSCRVVDPPTIRPEFHHG